MDHSTFVFGVCRDYVLDYATELGELENVLLGYIRSRSVSRLANCGDLFDPSKHGVEVFKHLRQVAAFVKKNAIFVDDTKAEATAQRAFAHAEVRCRIANRRLDHYYHHPERLPDDLRRWVSRMSSWIEETLGDFNTFVPEIPELIRVTSGATATRSRRQGLPHLKMDRRIDCPSTAVPLLTALGRYFNTKLKIKEVNCNRVEFVPKNWKTHRTIACEPTGVVPFQLAFDTWVKRGLRRRGINLSDQSLNQEYAFRGSLFGHLATIDLEAASDSLAFNTVAWLLPESWFRYVDMIRSPLYVDPVTGRFEHTPSSVPWEMGLLLRWKLLFLLQRVTP